MSLNPFFIRSIVQSRSGRDERPFGCVLIPSSSGQSFNRNCVSRTCSISSLNPFFIRSIVQSKMLMRPSHEACLNPFFIRSIVQSSWRPSRTYGKVLIPSSSGQSFNPKAFQKFDAYQCLNPFFIRSIVQSQRESGEGRHLSLNPFFIRSIVQSRPRRQQRPTLSLNPLFIRSIVQSG